MLTDGFLRQTSLISGHKHSITCNPGAVRGWLMAAPLAKASFLVETWEGSASLQRSVQMMPLGEGFLQRWSKLQVVTNIKYYKCG